MPVHSTAPKPCSQKQRSAHIAWKRYAQGQVQCYGGTSRNQDSIFSFAHDGTLCINSTMHTFLFNNAGI